MGGRKAVVKKGEGVVDGDGTRTSCKMEVSWGYFSLHSNLVILGQTDSTQLTKNPMKNLAPHM